MSVAKMLNLPYEKLVEIAKALNYNNLSNRIRDKENKISTDRFIRDAFNISRKDFSITIKNTGIKYNPSTFLYEIPENTNEIEPKEVDKGSIEVNLIENMDESNRNAIGLPKFTNEIPGEIKDLVNLSDDLKEMLIWWKSQSDNDTNNIFEINFNDERLSGEVATKSYKIYKNIAEEFSKFADTRKESVKDLVSVALIEFIDKYKKSK